MRNNEAMLLLAMVPAFLYVQLIMRFTFGWFATKPANRAKEVPDGTIPKVDDVDHFHPAVSVVVAARNEEALIYRCLDSIALQQYLPFELIVVNDHSTDKTEAEVHRVAERYPTLSLRLLQAEGEGKKSAITQAVKASKGALILVTDADCQVSPNWIGTFVASYRHTGARCISGPVRMWGKGAFGAMQALEFLSLVGSGGGSIGAGMPVMCNGANLCWERSAFDAVGGFDGNHRYASGDDIFLMLKISRTFPRGAVTFLRDRNAIVTTPAQPTLRDFFRQRMRWSSKSPGYTDFGIIFTAVAVFLMNAAILVTLLLGLITTNWQPFWLVFISKLIIDLPLLVLTSTFLRQGRVLLWYLPVQLLMPLYVLITALGGMVHTVSWKGRPVRRSF